MQEWVPGEFVSVYRTTTVRPDTRFVRVTPLENRDQAGELNPAVKPECQQPALHATIAERFESIAHVHSERTALRDGVNCLTYRELNEAAEQIALAILANSDGRPGRVALLLDHGAPIVSGFMGVLKAGSIAVPLDPEYPASRIDFILEDSQAELILSSGKLLSRAAELARHGRKVLNIEDLEVQERPTATPPCNAPNGTAYLIYTSGSTGKPKGVMLPHRTVLQNIDNYENGLQIRLGDRLTLLHSVAFSAGVVDVLMALLTGATLCCWPLRERGFAGLAEWMIRERVTVFHWMPSGFRHFCQSLSDDVIFPDMRMIVLGSEPMYRRDFELYCQHFPDDCVIVNRLGLTETGFVRWLFMDKTAEITGDLVPVGYEVPFKDVLILDDRLRPVPRGTAGQIAVRSQFLASGYWNRPELTQEVFREDDSGQSGRTYLTGDLGVMHSDGCLEYLGRKDHQIKVHGYRIEAGEIESALTEIDGIADAVVVQQNGDTGGNQLAAFLIADGGYTILPPDTLRNQLDDRLPAYMLPAAFVTLDDFPRTPTGKIDRQTLSRLAGDAVQVESDFRPPRTDTERQLAEIWQEILGVERVGVDESFFELGGHSLLALTLLTRVSKTFGIELQLHDLFAAPSVANLAEKIERRRHRADRDAGFEDRAVRITARPKERHEPFPLNDIQQAYWIGRTAAVELGGVSQHVYLEFDCVDLDLDRLSGAWQKVVARHDMLRAVILDDGRQQVLERVPPYEIPVEDLRGESEELIQARLQQARQRMSHQVLPCDRWPLFEIRASRVDDRRVRLHCSFDSMILDFRSRFIVFSEWHEFYQDADCSLPALEVTFRDYVLDEIERTKTERYEQSRDYWVERVPSLPPAPQLPLARDPGELNEIRFAPRKRRIEQPVWDRIKRRGAQSGLTPSGLLIAAFSEVLRLWSRSPKFTINLTFLERHSVHPQVNDIVGDFTSLVLLEVDNDEADTFEARARRLQEQLWTDLSHRSFNGVRVLRELARSDGGRPRAMMPVVFTSLLTHDTSVDGRDLMSWMGETVFNVSQTPQVWLDHVAREQNGALVFNWYVIEEMFPEGLLDDMLESYCRLLHRLADDQACWQESAADMAESLLPPEQRTQRTRVNGTAAPVPQGLLFEPFIEQAQRRPNAPAVVACDWTLTYGELLQRSTALARRLRDEGVRPNELVAVVMEKGWEQVVAVLGIQQAGAAYLPVDASLPGERLRHLLRHGEARLAVTQSRFVSHSDWPAGVRCIELESAPPAQVTPETLEPVQSPDDLAYVIYTSGSTGEPKGVMIDHRGALNTIADINRRFDIGPDDRILALSSLGFDLSVYDVFGTLAAGGTIVIPEPTSLKDPSRWAEWMKAERITVWNSVPALMDLLLEHLSGSRSSLEHLRLVLLSGDWIPVDLPDRLRSLAPDAELISLGGATEASIWSILYPVDAVDPDWPSIPYGRPMTNQTFHVLNDRLEACPVWAPGELYIGGVGLAQGYWKDDEQTQARFVRHPGSGERLYRTGDLGRFLPDGNIEFLGRDDFQVKIQGNRIELSEIESALGRHPEIRSSIVAAVGKSPREKRLVAYVVPHDGAPPAPEELRRFLAGKLPPYMVPSSFVVLDRLPLTANGKVDRSALPEPSESSRTNGRSRAISSHENAQSQIAQCVAAVLSIDHVPPSENLLTLGASSVDMIRIANRLEEELGFRPDINAFYRSPSVSTLSEMFEQDHASKHVGRATYPGSGTLFCGTGAARPLISDPLEREQFKQSRPGLRCDLNGATRVPLAGADAEIPAAERTPYFRRRSHRKFARRPIGLESFSGFLGCMRQLVTGGGPKYRYGSPGGLYPLQTYLYVKPEGVTGLQAGCWYYDPTRHHLALLSGQPDLDCDVYDPFINGPIFADSAFAIFLVAQMNALAPMYGEHSERFAAIEAGLAAQLLETTAADFELGLCQVGTLRFELLRPLLRLDESHQFVHSLLGGPIEQSERAAWTPFVEAARPSGSGGDDAEEGVL
ncbi:MAG: amino acid adenylation domain-containing protein [Planctomycetota bacterium]|nr:MAG: amino acid adenylation domain-containing protein [Planctomycetota bacterium]